MAIKQNISPPNADKIETKYVDINLSKAEIQIVEYLCRNQFITNHITRGITGLGNSAARNLLKRLVDKDIVSFVGERKGRKYMLKQNIERDEE